MKAVFSQEGEESILLEVKEIEDKVGELIKRLFAQGQGQSGNFTHVGYVKNLKRESSFAVLGHFLRPLDPEDSISLMEFLNVTHDIVWLFSRVLELENSRTQRVNAAKCQGHLELLDKVDKVAMEQVQDKAVLARWKECSEKLRGIIERVGDAKILSL